ncbi:MAG TPA: glycosyltransferase 61 family protein [Magnetospirillaceae bacterium]|nr:glycosyltransferase 61 family protein [Magnetospirillaceae bacterium]
MPYPLETSTHNPFVFTSVRRCARRAASAEDFFAASDDCYLVEAPAETVHIPPPDVYHGFGPETLIWNSYHGESKPYGDFSYQVTEQLTAKFHDVEIASGTFFPFVDTNLAISDIYHGPKIIATHWNPYIVQANTDPNLQSDLLLRPRVSTALRIPEDVLSLDFLWNSYYYHFLIECLPKFLRVRDTPQFAAMPILWRMQSVPYIAHYLRALGFWDRLIPMAGDVARCDRAYIMSPTSPNGWTRRGLMTLREAIFPAFGIEPAARPHGMILLSRRDAKSRRILNEAALEAALAPLGFNLVVPGELPVAEQIRLFADARLIVGPHGSAWANIVYGAAGAGMLEIQPQGTNHPAMYSIAKLMGVNYGSYMCDQLAPDGDMLVDVDRVVEMVRALLELSPL